MHCIVRFLQSHFFVFGPAHARIQKVLSEGVEIWFFFSWWGIEDPNTAINVPSSALQRNAIEMAFRWRADDGPTLNAGLVALWFSGDPGQYYKEALYFVIFRGGGGGGGPDPLSPLWIRSCSTWYFSTYYLWYLVLIAYMCKLIL